jgi:hypothetical protein
MTKKRLSLGLAILLIAVLVGCSNTSSSQNANPAHGLAWATVAGTLAHGNLELSTPAPRATHDLDQPMTTLLSDNFSDPGSGWDVSTDDYGSSAYIHGTYRLKAIQKTYYSWRSAGLNVDNLRIDVDVDVVATNSKKDDGFGVDCRIQENGDGYAFRISSDGYISVSVFENLEQIPLVEWELNSAVHTDGQINHLTAICDADHLKLIVNDVPVADVVDQTFSSGDVALSVISFEDQPTTVDFDNLIVQQFNP